MILFNAASAGAYWERLLALPLGERRGNRDIRGGRYYTSTSTGHLLRYPAYGYPAYGYPGYPQSGSGYPAYSGYGYPGYGYPGDYAYRAY